MVLKAQICCHIRTLLISLFYSDVALNSYIPPWGVVLHICENDHPQGRDISITYCTAHAHAWKTKVV